MLTYFEEHRTNGKNIYTENEIISIFDFLIHNVEEFWGHICQQIIDIPTETKCASLPVDLFFIHNRQSLYKTLSKTKELWRKTRTFNVGILM